MGIRGDLSGFECRIVVGVGRAGLTLTEDSRSYRSMGTLVGDDRKTCGNSYNHWLPSRYAEYLNV